MARAGLVTAAGLAAVRTQSGEGRFRWLHAVRGAESDLLAAPMNA